MIELIPESYVSRLEPAQIFGRVAPLVVDLGCGDGSFLAAMAKSDPARNFLGLERLAGRVRTTARKASTLPNVRVLRVETSYAVRYLLPAESVQVFYLLFPDPWPKRRHAARRLVTEKFLASLHRALVSNGAVHVATDEAQYFREITRLVSASPDFSIIPNSSSAFPSTKFERRFRARGVPIQRLELRKVSPVT